VRTASTGSGRGRGPGAYRPRSTENVSRWADTRRALRPDPAMLVRQRETTGLQVLILGGARYVGQLLVFRLLAAGHHVTLLNRGAGNDPFGARVERLRADRSSDELERALARRHFDAAVDLGALTEVDAHHTVDVLSGKVGHYVAVSTGQVYLVRDGCPRPAREEDYEGPLLACPATPDDAEHWKYGMAKRACEDALDAAWRDGGFPVTRVRIPMVNGERDPARRIEGYLWRLIDGGPLLLPEGGVSPVRHVYAGEVARALAGLLGRESTFGQAYNLAQEETVTVSGLVAKLRDELGSAAEIVPVSTETLQQAGLEPRSVSPFSERWMSALDASRAQRELDFHHEPLDAYLGKIVASFLAHPPATAPEGYAWRGAELELARKLPRST
jgi:nucleoside-diphosphate-sugar epimerase